MTVSFADRPAAPDKLIARVTDTLANWLPSRNGAASVIRWGRTEWQIAGWVAYWQNAVPWLAERIRESDVELPADIAKAIFAIEAESRKRTRAMLANAVEFGQLFQAAGIQLLFLKGAVLATSYYPDPTKRPLADLDVLIRKRDLKRSVEILLDLGYRFFSRSAEDEVFLRGERKENIWAADNVHPIELHFTLREEYAGIGYNLAEEMWTNSHRAAFWDGYEALLPRPAALLHHICAHATSDWLIQRGRLMQIDDIRWICATMNDGEWQRFAESVPANGARFVYPALAFTNRYARVDIPEGIMDTLRSNCSSALLAWVDTSHLSDNSEANSADRSALGLKVAQRLSLSPYDQARFWLRSIFPRRWNLTKRYPRLVKTPFWMVGYLLLNVDRIFHIIKRRQK